MINARFVSGKDEVRSKPIRDDRLSLPVSLSYNVLPSLFFPLASTIQSLPIASPIPTDTHTIKILLRAIVSSLYQRSFPTSHNCQYADLPYRSIDCSSDCYRSSTGGFVSDTIHLAQLFSTLQANIMTVANLANINALKAVIIATTVPGVASKPTSSFAAQE